MNVLKFQTISNRSKVRDAAQWDARPVAAHVKCLYLPIALRCLYDRVKRPMPSITFQECECGVEFKIAKLFDDHRQVYRCVCGRDTEILGSILELYSSVRTYGGQTEWIKVPMWKIQDSP